MKEKKEKKEKEELVPKFCKCGKPGIVVVHKSKKMVSCPDPVNCCTNRRTLWYGNKDEAIIAWNNGVFV